MHKSIRKINFNRLMAPGPRSTLNPYRIPFGTSAFKTSRNFHNKLLKQLVFCVVLVLLVIMIKNINTPFTNRAEELIETSINQEFDIRNSFGTIIKYAQEIPKIPDRVVSVFQTNENNILEMNLIAPVYGEIVSNFGESYDPILNQNTFRRGIDILILDNETVKSIADGEIIEVGEGSALGKYIKVKHANELISIYGNFTAITVLKGQKVQQGQTIGEMHKKTKGEDSFLYFELWKQGEVVDPVGYIRFDKRIL